MLVFASRVQKTIPIPSDPSQSVLIQKLPRRHLIAAEKSQRATVFSDIRQQFGDQWQETIRTFKADEKVQKAAKDPLLQFDVDVLLKFGVKAWTFEDVPLSDEALADLDTDTSEHIAREVLRLTVPKLFETEDGEERKNDSASSGAA